MPVTDLFTFSFKSSLLCSPLRCVIWDYGNYLPTGNPWGSVNSSRTERRGKTECILFLSSYCSWQQCPSQDISITECICEYVFNSLNSKGYNEEKSFIFSPTTVTVTPGTHNVNFQSFKKDSFLILKSNSRIPFFLIWKLRRRIYLGQKIHLSQQIAEHLVYIFVWLTHLKKEEIQI